MRNSQKKMCLALILINPLSSAIAECIAIKPFFRDGNFKQFVKVTNGCGYCSNGQVGVYKNGVIEWGVGAAFNNLENSTSIVFNHDASPAYQWTYTVTKLSKCPGSPKPPPGPPSKPVKYGKEYCKSPYAQSPNESENIYPNYPARVAGRTISDVILPNKTSLLCMSADKFPDFSSVSCNAFINDPRLNEHYKESWRCAPDGQCGDIDFSTLFKTKLTVNNGTGNVKSGEQWCSAVSNSGDKTYKAMLTFSPIKKQ